MTENQDSIERNIRLVQQADDAPAGRLSLVALPWSQKDRPSSALAALGAYVRRERPVWELACHHSFVDFAARIGFDLYDALADHAYAGGELLNLSLLYPEKAADARRQFETWANKTLSEKSPHSIESGAWGKMFDFVRATLDEYLDEPGEGPSAQGGVLRINTGFRQTFVKPAVGQPLKQRAPQNPILLGGSTVSRRLGAAVVAEYHFLG